MEKIPVSEYNIVLGKITDSLDEYIQQAPDSSLFILTDENTYSYCLPLIQKVVQHRKHYIYKIRAGELNKNIHTCMDIWKAMTTAQLDRNSMMINLGGGVIGDIGGFCASTYKRGIDFIQIPTTLLSQVDASIGGKLGIDFESFKNHIGVFNFPIAVLIDPIFLNTLPHRELRSGYAEVIKHCLIADGDHWKELSQITDLRSQDWAAIIRRSLEVKRKIVIADPYEKGIRKLLNFGHTIGHAIESLLLETNSPLLHGEAIAAGMIYESKLSSRYMGLSMKDEEQIIDYIEKIFGAPPVFSIENTIPIMKQDKKNSNGKISFSLLKKIGDSQWDILLDESQLKDLN